MKNGYHKIIWGLFFSVFRINLGAIPILPAFVGWLIIVTGTKLVAEEADTDYFNKAHNYAIITSAISFGMQIFAWSGFDNEVTLFLSIIYAIFELLYIYYLLQGSIDYLNLAKEESLALHYQSKQKTFTIAFIINTIISCIGLALSSAGLVILSSIIGVILIIWFMFIVRDLKNIELDSFDQYI